MAAESPPSRREFDRLEERVNRLEEAKVDVLAERVRNQGDQIHDLAIDFRDMRKALYTAAVTVAIGAVGTMMTVYLVFGQ